MNYFEYNGVKSSDMGLRIKSKNVYSSPRFDSQFVSVPGRNGDLIVSNNRFENIQISYNVFLSAKSVDELADKLRKVKSWLYSQPTGYHTLADSYDKKFFRKAVFASSLDIEDELNKIGLFTISFNCKPFKYSFDGNLPHYIKSTVADLSDFSLIFCRMDGSTSDNNWDNRWNQTVDLKLSGENNMYIIAENSWSDGNWGTYSPSQSNTVYLQVNENWKKDNARFAVFIFGSKGEHWYSMTKVTDNIYSAVLPTPSYTTLENPYSFESKPYIRVFGNGDGTLTIESQNGRQQWSFKNIDEYLEIDSEQMNFYKDTVLKNDTVTGSGFPTLATGENKFILGGGVTSLSVFPRWCTL